MPDDKTLQEAVTAALQRIVLTGRDRDVASGGLVRSLGISDGRVRVTYEVATNELNDALRAELTDKTHQTLATLDGVRHVEVEIGVKPPPRATSDIPGVKHVIAVGAGKGGVGKSTVALLLAVGLQRRGMKAGLLDADVYGPSLPLLTGTTDAAPEIDSETGRVRPPRFGEIPIMSMGYLIPPNQAVVWRGPMAQKYVKEFLDRGDWGELDYLIVDLPPGTGDIPLTLAQSIPVTGAVVVCTPQDVALLDATKAVRMFQKLNVPPLGMVENMSYHICGQCGHREEIFGHGGARTAAERLGIPFLGELPLKLSIRVWGDEGKPFAHYTDSEPQVIDALEEMVTSVVESVRAATRQSSPLPQLRVQ